jgi:hypothetical protein
MHRPKHPARRGLRPQTRRLKTTRLRETRAPLAPSASIIDAEFTLVRKRRRLSWLAWSIAAALSGGLAGFLAPPLVAMALGLG